MTYKRFINNYLCPFMKAYDRRIIDIRHIERTAGYQLINITLDSGRVVSIDITGKNAREITNEVIRHINEYS